MNAKSVRTTTNPREYKLLLFISNFCTVFCGGSFIPSFHLKLMTSFFYSCLPVLCMTHIKKCNSYIENIKSNLSESPPLVTSHPYRAFFWEMRVQLKKPLGW